MEAISNKHCMENSSGEWTVHMSQYEMKLFSKQLVAFTKQIMCDVVSPAETAEGHKNTSDSRVSVYPY